MLLIFVINLYVFLSQFHKDHNNLNHGDISMTMCPTQGDIKSNCFVSYLISETNCYYSLKSNIPLQLILYR